MKKLHEVILIFGGIMQNNVIKFSRSNLGLRTPDDLMSVKAFALKHDMKIGYLYKLQTKGIIKRYKRGVWKISESEVLKALGRME